MENSRAKRLISDSEVARRYGVHPSTLYNWDHNSSLNFPKPVRINRRKFRDQAELDAFDKALAAERGSSSS